jgi:hypothetical protein
VTADGGEVKGRAGRVGVEPLFIAEGKLGGRWRASARDKIDELGEEEWEMMVSGELERVRSTGWRVGWARKEVIGRKRGICRFTEGFWEWEKGLEVEWYGRMKWRNWKKRGWI